jgi:hypothetical protein
MCATSTSRALQFARRFTTTGTALFRFHSDHPKIVNDTFLHFKTIALVHSISILGFLSPYVHSWYTLCEDYKSTWIYLKYLWLGERHIKYWYQHFWQVWGVVLLNASAEMQVRRTARKPPVSKLPASSWGLVVFVLCSFCTQFYLYNTEFCYRMKPPSSGPRVLVLGAWLYGTKIYVNTCSMVPQMYPRQHSPPRFLNFESPGGEAVPTTLHVIWHAFLAY